MKLSEEIRTLVNLIEKNKKFVKNEADTKQIFVFPFIKALGFDTGNASEVKSEYVADFSQKGNKEKVDIAIFENEIPIIFIEVKKAGAELDESLEQIKRYFNSNPVVKTAIITDGIFYRFFTDLIEPNIMDKEPFFEFDIALADSKIKTIELFTKEKYNKETSHSIAKKKLILSYSVPKKSAQRKQRKRSGNRKVKKQEKHNKELSIELNIKTEYDVILDEINTQVNDFFKEVPVEIVRAVLQKIAISRKKIITNKFIKDFTPVVRRAIQSKLNPANPENKP